MLVAELAVQPVKFNIIASDDQTVLDLEQLLASNSILSFDVNSTLDNHDNQPIVLKMSAGGILEYTSNGYSSQNMPPLQSKELTDDEIPVPETDVDSDSSEVFPLQFGLNRKKRRTDSKPRISESEHNSEEENLPSAKEKHLSTNNSGKEKTTKNSSMVQESNNQVVDESSSHKEIAIHYYQKTKGKDDGTLKRDYSKRNA